MDDAHGDCDGAEEAKFSARIDPTYGTTGQVHINHRRDQVDHPYNFKVGKQIPLIFSYLLSDKSLVSGNTRNFDSST